MSLEPDISSEVGRLKRELEESERRRKKLEKNIESVEKRLRLIVENVNEIVYALDSNGLITFISDGVKRYGFSAEELLGMSILELVHPEDRERAVHRVNERRTGERCTRSYEIRFLTKSRWKKVRVGGAGEPGEFPLVRVTAEGQYFLDDENRLSFAGTFGVVIEDGGTGETECVSRYLIPVCANCKSIRDAAGRWDRMENFLDRCFHLKFTHTICPECMRRLYPGMEED